MGINLKFRVWDNRRKRFISSEERPANAYFCIWSGQWMGCSPAEYRRFNKDLIIQQFTGLKDKNSREIYEGDILQVNYTSGYEILDESGKFVKWSDDEKEFVKNYEVIWYSGDYEINASEYTIGLNGWAAKLLKDARKSTHNEIGKIASLSILPKEVNYGFYGLVATGTEIIGNIFENSELLK